MKKFYNVFVTNWNQDRISLAGIQQTKGLETISKCWIETEIIYLRKPKPAQKQTDKATTLILPKDAENFDLLKCSSFW